MEDQAADMPEEVTKKKRTYHARAVGSESVGFME
jgi:hypothetical protein